MCPYCSADCIRYGKSNTGNTRFRCKSCKRTHVSSYVYRACHPSIPKNIASHIKEGCGIRSIARLLDISVSTVLRVILRTANRIKKPPVAIGKEYELDELRTYIITKCTPCWIVYAIRKDTREVVDFTVGNRTSNTLRSITEPLILSSVAKIYTDKLPHYKSLIPKGIHKITPYGTNHIERKNLTLRTHLKRLSRRTICFSRSAAMLTACLKIYFWG